jgi:hypothetical protein
MSTQKKRLTASKSLTLAGLIDLLGDDPELPSAKRARWISAIHGIARGLDRSPGMLPASPADLSRHLSKMTGVYHRAQVRKSTWKSYLADYRTATRYVGLVRSAPGSTRRDQRRGEHCCEPDLAANAIS